MEINELMEKLKNYLAFYYSMNNFNRNYIVSEMSGTKGILRLIEYIQYEINHNSSPALTKFYHKFAKYFDEITSEDEKTYETQYFMLISRIKSLIGEYEKTLEAYRAELAKEGIEVYFQRGECYSCPSLDNKSGEYEVVLKDRVSLGQFGHAWVTLDDISHRTLAYHDESIAEEESRIAKYSPLADPKELKTLRRKNNHHEHDEEIGKREEAIKIVESSKERLETYQTHNANFASINYKQEHALRLLLSHIECFHSGLNELFTRLTETYATLVGIYQRNASLYGANVETCERHVKKTLELLIANSELEEDDVTRILAEIEKIVIKSSEGGYVNIDYTNRYIETALYALYAAFSPKDLSKEEPKEVKIF